jgi:hypothetical protein
LLQKPVRWDFRGGSSRFILEGKRLATAELSLQ